MKIVMIFTGKTEEAYLKEGLDIYLNRIKRYIPAEVKILEESGKKRSRSSRDTIRESEIISSAGKGTSYLVFLDENGKKLSSEGFAGFIENIATRGYKELVFITGGAYGFSEGLKKYADHSLSLSDMTFTHQMARLILAEQVYRAMTIIKNEPYHHA